MSGGRSRRPPRWGADDELLDALGEALGDHAGRGGVPPGFVAAGKAAYAWYGVEAELAALSCESSLWPALVPTASVPLEPALVRTDVPTSRLLSYRAGGLIIEVEVTATAVHGQLIPIQRGRVDVYPGPTVLVEVDELGYFVIRPAPRIPFRLRCRTAGLAVLTDWIEPLRPMPTLPTSRRRVHRQPLD